MIPAAPYQAKAHHLENRPGNADYGRRKSGNFIASIMRYIERKSEVEQGIEEQRLEMENVELKFEREKQASEAELRRQELDSVQREREASGKAEESERQERRDRERNDREEARQDRQAMMQLMQTMMNNMQRSGVLSAERQLGTTSPLVEEALSAASLWRGQITGNVPKGPFNSNSCLAHFGAETLLHGPE